MSLQHKYEYYIWRNGAFELQLSAPTAHEMYYVRVVAQQAGHIDVWYANRGGHDRHVEIPINDCDLPKQLTLLMFLQE